MFTLSDYPAKICLTSAGMLIHQSKVLLVKHKKLQIWLNPGGHIEANEKPHQAAEREFWEETGIKVRTYFPAGKPQIKGDDSEYLPNPILTNLHWVSKKNFDTRMQNGEEYQRQPEWQRGCEQHLNFLYLVEPIAGVEFQQDVTETDGIQWFSLKEVEEMEIPANIKYEIQQGFAYV